MGILSWFSKSAPPDYETLLSRLASEVHEAKVHLSEIRLRERRFSLLINLYGLALWGLFFGLWWFGSLPFGLIGWKAKGNEARIAGAAGVLIGPVLLHHMYFARQRRYEEENLRKLLAEQKKQVDAVKKATNYDATRKLIEEYDVSNGFGGQAQGGRQGQSPKSGGPVTPQRGQQSGSGPQTPTGPLVKGATPLANGSPRAPGHLVGAGGTPMPAGTPMRIPEGMTAEQAAMMQMHAQQMAIQPVLPTPEKKWYDRVVDSILGEDPSHASQSKYALVCGECFRHNGLVGSKYEWERMQWICPRCNHMNPPPLSRAPLQNGNGPQATGKAPSSTVLASPGTPSQLPRQAAAATRQRRQLGETSTPRGSRLRQEVFTAGDADGDTGQGEGSSDMDLDEQT